MERVAITTDNRIEYVFNFLFCIPPASCGSKYVNNAVGSALNNRKYWLANWKLPNNVNPNIKPISNLSAENKFLDAKFVNQLLRINLNFGFRTAIEIFSVFK